MQSQDVASYFATVKYHALFDFYIFVQTNSQDRLHTTAALLAGKLPLFKPALQYIYVCVWCVCSVCVVCV